jgi:hypothetical protein
LIDRVVRFIQDALFFGTGRFVLRVVSLGRLNPTLSDRRQPWVIFLGVLVIIGAIAGTAVWLDSPSGSPAGRSLFQTKAEFQAYVARLDLASVPTGTAIERLTSQGFQCETFKDGNVACFREARGTICGERQFVDLLVPGKNGAAHGVSTRFGRVCL